MEKSKVYFTNLRTYDRTNLLEKLEKLIKEAGIGNIDFEDKFTVIKIHFGEPGNLAYLRPNYAKRVVDVVRQFKGKPFLSDCNTLYVGRRKNGLDHMDATYENGYNPFATGCHIIIADGIKGLDEELVPVDHPNKKHVNEAKIGRAFMEADIFISLNHFKGHEGAGFGGALKNIGMGCGSRAGKMEMHCSGKPEVTAAKCRSCGACIKNCAHGAISFDANNKAVIDPDKCVGCGRCIGSCNFDAIRAKNFGANDLLNERIAEYSYAVLKDRPHFHISLVIDVSPYCDCHGNNDLPISPDVGIFASFDPVALDVACADAVNASPVIPGSRLDEMEQHTHDHFIDNHPETNWKSCIAHAIALDLGTDQYELIEVK